MLLGSGCDILYINRVESLLKYKNFIKKFFTYNEIDMFNSQKNKHNYIKKIASNLSVKEAFFKSIAHKINDFNFKDVEVLRDKDGRPYINLFGKLREFNKKNNIKIHVTISNEKDVVVSFVILEEIN